MSRYMKFFMLILSVLFSILLAEKTFAQINQPKEIQTSQKFGAYTIHYNVFNTKMLTPAIADTYKITRGKNIVLINIALTKTDNGTTSLGTPAKINGNAINLMQQSQKITFKEIKEADPNGTNAVYYLAEYRHTNEEDIRFEINVVPEGETKPLSINFSRRLFTEN